MRCKCYPRFLTEYTTSKQYRSRPSPQYDYSREIYSVCVFSVLRITAIRDGRVFPDSLYAIWSMLEPSLGITTASLPIMQPLSSKLSALISTIFPILQNVTHHSPQALSRKKLDPRCKIRDTEDMLYPLSVLCGTTNEFSTNQRHTKQDPIGDYGREDHINVERVFDVAFYERAKIYG